MGESIDRLLAWSPRAAPRRLVSYAPPVSIFGFPVHVRPFYVLVVALLGSRGRLPSDQASVAELALWMVVVTLSILWHELGHAFVMRRYGYSPSIELHGMGGATFWNGGPAPTPMQRVWVSLAGPFAGFVLGALMAAVYLLPGPLPYPVERTVQWMLWVNVGWGLVNLVPMVPWDGGNALHGLLDRLTNGRGARPTAIVTFVVGGLALAYVGLVLRELWLSLLVILSLTAAYRLWQASAPVRAIMPARPRAAPPADPGEDVREALARVGPEVLVSAILRRHPSLDWRAPARALETGLASVEEPSARAEGAELTAWAHLMAGDVDAAEALVTGMAPSHRPSPALAALLAARRGRWVAALEAVGELDLEEEGAVRRRIEAEALVALRRPDEAVRLVEGADRATAAFVDESLFREGHFDAAARLGERLFERFREPDDAYNVACAQARAGRPHEALAWLERAVEAGYRDLAHVEGDEDLAPVRRLAGFEALRARMKSPDVKS